MEMEASNEVSQRGREIERARLQLEVDAWLVHTFGDRAEELRSWFDLSKTSSEGVLGEEDLTRLLVGLLKCPLVNYHFDVHPHPIGGLETLYAVYVEPSI